MIGKRVDSDGSKLMNPGEYGKVSGVWHGMAPAEAKDRFGFLANLAKHKVVEHEDGTITVSPSILITRHDGTWHGYLERGVWREA